MSVKVGDKVRFKSDGVATKYSNTIAVVLGIGNEFVRVRSFDGRCGYTRMSSVVLQKKSSKSKKYK